MSRFIPGTLLLVAASAASALVGPTGCVENRSSFYVVGALTEPDDCVFQFDGSQTRLERGVHDTVFGRSFAPMLLLGNQYVPLGNNDQIRTETSRIQLRGAEVSLSSVEGGELANFTTTTSGTVDPAPSSAPGFGGTTVMMIPSDLEVSSGEYLATVRVFGRTLGGQNIETGEFVFPIQVCRGCLLHFSEESRAAGTCIRSSDPPVGWCFPGQNKATDCSLCPGTNRSPLCDSPPPL